MSEEKKTRAPKKNLAQRFEEQINEEVAKYEADKAKLATRELSITRMREALVILKASPAATAKAAAAGKK